MIIFDMNMSEFYMTIFVMKMTIFSGHATRISNSTTKNSRKSLIIGPGLLSNCQTAIHYFHLNLSPYMISICLELSLFGRTLYGLQNNFKRKNIKVRVFFGWDYTDKTGNLG